MSKVFHLMDVNSCTDIEHEGMKNPIYTLRDKETALNYFQDQLGKKLSFTPPREGDEPVYSFCESDTKKIEFVGFIEVYEIQ